MDIPAIGELFSLVNRSQIMRWRQPGNRHPSGMDGRVPTTMRGVIVDLPLKWGRARLIKSPYREVGVQIGNNQSAPPKFSTPFPKDRYQIIAVFGERCHYFCKKSSVFCKIQDNYIFFYVYHKTFTVFAYKIRAPPSEV